MAQYVLNTVENPSPQRALIATSCTDDYLQDSILHGLKRMLGHRLTDFVPEARELPAEDCVNDRSNAHTPLPDYRLNMYMDSWAARSKSSFQLRVGYGKGFTIWNRLSKLSDGNIDRTHVYEDVRKKSFHLVFITDRVMRSSEQKQFVDHVRCVYTFIEAKQCARQCCAFDYRPCRTLPAAPGLGSVSTVPSTACRPIRRLGKYTSFHIAGGSVLAVIWQCQAVLNPSQNSRPKQISVRGRRSAQANVLRVTHC